MAASIGFAADIPPTGRRPESSTVSPGRIRNFPRRMRLWIPAEKIAMKTYDPDKNVKEVRQGNRRLMNMRVLVYGIIGIVVAFALIFLWFAVFAPAGSAA
jgi:hypothetical protein